MRRPEVTLEGFSASGLTYRSASDNCALYHLVKASSKESSALASFIFQGLARPAALHHFGKNYSSFHALARPDSAFRHSGHLSVSRNSLRTRSLA